jgi:hypothetical protein
MIAFPIKFGLDFGAGAGAGVVVGAFMPAVGRKIKTGLSSLGGKILGGIASKLPQPPAAPKA